MIDYEFHDKSFSSETLQCISEIFSSVEEPPYMTQEKLHFPMDHQQISYSDCFDYLQ